MNTTIRLVIALVLLLIVPQALGARRTPKCIDGTVSRVVDGDTLKVDDGKQIHTIRLYGIDTPEKRLPGRWEAQAYALEATEYAEAFVLDKPVTVLTRGRGAYQRIIGEVFVDGRSLNRELVRAGLAWWTVRYTPRDKDIARLEADARKAKRGLWVDADAVRPSDHRKKKVK